MTSVKNGQAQAVSTSQTNGDPPKNSDKDSDASPPRLRRDINFLYASAIMTGVIIGSGIFVSPVSFAKNSGSVASALIMWVASGILSLCVALSFTELGLIYPKAGGDFIFMLKIMGPGPLGDLPAFAHAFLMFACVQPTFLALLAITTADYLFSAIFPDCSVPATGSTLFAIWVVVTIAVLNCAYVRYVTRVQTVLVVLKLAALGLIIVIGIIQLCRGRFGSLPDGFDNTNPDPGSHAISIYSGIFTYMGWQYIFCLMEEVKEPEKVIPKAVTVSLLLVTALYTFTNVAYFSVMSPQQMIESPAVAMTFSQRTLGGASIIMPIFVAASTIGSLNGALLGGSRIYFAAARENMFPSIVSSIQTKFLTPWPSIISVSALACLYIITGDAVRLVEYLGLSASLMLDLILMLLLWLRWTQPDLHRPYKVPLVAPVLSCVALTVVLFVGVWFQPYQNGIGLLICLTGVPVYFISKCFTKPPILSRKLNDMYLIIQKVLLVVKSDT